MKTMRPGVQSVTVGILLATAALVAFGALYPGATNASQAGGAGGSGIPTVYDPHTGGYRLQQPLASTIQPNTASTGTFVYNFTITIKSTIPTSNPIICAAEPSVTESASGQTWFDIKFVDATRSGSTATCSISVPYAWKLNTASSDKVDQSIFVGTPSDNFFSPPVSFPARVSGFNLSQISVPANGSTTTEAITSTI
jgi:hypothetical protein